MSYIDEELKIGVEEDEDEEFSDLLDSIPEEDDLLDDDEFTGLSDSEY